MIEHSAIHRIEHSAIHRIEHIEIYRIGHIEIYRIEHIEIHRIEHIQIRRIEHRAIDRLDIYRIKVKVNVSLLYCIGQYTGYFTRKHPMHVKRRCTLVDGGESSKSDSCSSSWFLWHEWSCQQ